MTAAPGGDPAPAVATGPLAGLRFVEMAGIGPVPMAARILVGMGATGVRLDPPQPGLLVPDARIDLTMHGRDAVVVDLKHPDGPSVALRLIETAEVLLEGFRPGVMERLGLGPQVCLDRNPRLVYGRMTGYGQEGPWAQAAGHDLNYVAVAGALRHFARAGQAPVPPLNLVADYGGGAMLLVTGVLAAVLSARSSGRGQVVDAAMIDGTAQLMTLFYGMHAAGLWDLDPGTNLLDTGAPFYDIYACADEGGFVVVGCLEPPFYAAFLAGLGLAAADLPDQYDRAAWPQLRERFADALATRTRDDWAAVFEGTDACVTPVLDMIEAAEHPQLAARSVLVEVDGVLQPATAPRFGGTPTSVPRHARSATDAATTLAEWGWTPAEIADVSSSGAMPQRGP